MTIHAKCTNQSRSTQPLTSLCHLLDQLYKVGSSGYSFDTAAGIGHFNFSAGGQQCNRQESSHGPLIIEGVYEELDAAGEFFFNTTTRILTLWHNATSGTPPPTDGSVVVPAITTLIAARGSQAAPVKDLVVNGIGIRDTAPSIMLPHTGPRYVRASSSTAIVL
jgi:hypothetical protein